jgi:CDP-glucose 4,6-dehydratase
VFNNIFQNKRVIVTGDTGFKGSWLSLWLHELGANVLGYALPPKQENDHFHLLKLNTIIKHIDGDICDYSKVQQIFDEFKPDFLFHLAAQPLVRLSYNEPKLTLDTNIGGSINILEATRNTGSLRAAIFVTSDKCYRNKEWVWGYRENDELGGIDPYSASKAAVEIVFASYLESFFKKSNCGVASVRAGNVIGGGDWSQDRIVPDCIKALIAQEPIKLRNPQATRPWQHVLDPLYGYLLLASKLYNDSQIFSGSWNFGPRVESVRTVNNLVTEIVRLWGDGEVISTADEKSPHEASLLQLNCDKAHLNLNWQPHWDFDQTMDATVSWYQNMVKKSSILSTTKQQIDTFMEGLND